MSLIFALSKQDTLKKTPQLAHLDPPFLIVASYIKSVDISDDPCTKNSSKCKAVTEKLNIFFPKIQTSIHINYWHNLVFR